MKPKQTIDIDAAGAEVKRLLAEDNTASTELKDLRGQRAARKEAIKKMMTVVWQAFDKKQTVNGYADRATWMKEFAGRSRRWCEMQVYGRKPTDANKRAHALKVGGVLALDPKLFTNDRVGKKFKLLTFGEARKDANGHWHIELIGEAPGNEEQKPAPKKKKKGKRYSQKVHPGFMTMPGKPHKTHKVRDDGRTYCGKTLGDTLAKDARMSDTPTCRGCQTGLEHERALIEYAGQEKPAPKVKVKKMPPGRTNNAIDLMESMYKIKPANRDKESREWAERYLQFFDEQVKLHPEWRDKVVEVRRGKIKYQIKKRAYAEPEVSEPAQANGCEDYANNVPCEAGLLARELSEPAQALAAAVDDAVVPYDKEAYAKAETWGQKVCIRNSPENLEWRADLKHRQEFPPCDPNEDDEDEESEEERDETEEQL